LEKEYRFDEARSLRAVVIRKPAALSPVRASPPWSLHGRARSTNPGPGPRACHRPPADPPALAPRRFSVPCPAGPGDARFDPKGPPTELPARSPLAAASVAGHAPFPCVEV